MEKLLQRVSQECTPLQPFLIGRRQFVPDADLVREVTNTTERGGWMLDMPPATAGSSSFNKISHGGSPDLPPTGKSEFASQYGDDINIASENMKHLRIDNSNGRFFGSSSSYMFLQTALDLKGEYAGKEKAEHQELAKQAHLWATHPVSSILCWIYYPCVDIYYDSGNTAP
jgi:hypothetical protein